MHRDHWCLVTWLPVQTIRVYKVTVGIWELYAGQCAGRLCFSHPHKSFSPGVLEVLTDFVLVNCYFSSTCFASSLNSGPFYFKCQIITILSQDTLHIPTKKTLPGKSFTLSTPLVLGPVARKNFPLQTENSSRRWAKQRRGSNRDKGEGEIKKRRGGDGETEEMER